MGEIGNDKENLGRLRMISERKICESMLKKKKRKKKEIQEMKVSKRSV